jgi:FAD synthase
LKDVSRLNISQEEEEREFREHYESLKEVERSQQMLEQLELEAFVAHET